MPRAKKGCKTNSCRTWLAPGARTDPGTRRRMVAQDFTGHRGGSYPVLDAKFPTDCLDHKAGRKDRFPIPETWFMIRDHNLTESSRKRPSPNQAIFQSPTICKQRDGMWTANTLNHSIPNAGGATPGLEFTWMCRQISFLWLIGKRLRVMKFNLSGPQSPNQRKGDDNKCHLG